MNDDPPDERKDDREVVFKRFRSRVRMPEEQARRQGRIVTLALASLGSRDAALDFLNSHDRELDARPLDVASDSDDGFARVRARLDVLS